MKIKVSILLLVVLQNFYSFAQIKDAYDFSEIATSINQAIDKKEIPSVVVAVAKDGKIIYEKAFGFADSEKKIKATISTSYQLASASKPITATGLMVLNHKKMLDIDSSAERYMLPLKFNAYEGKSSGVKIIDLLNHTSGLGTYFELNYADENCNKNSFEMAFKKYGNLYHPSGLICEYSNMGYGLIDYIIAKQSGKTYSEFMKEEVFTPLGMKNSFVDNTNRSDISIAKKYDSNLKPLPIIVNNTVGAGNIYSSIHDLILFGLFHLNNGKQTILSKKEIDLMQSYVNKNTLYHYYDSTFYGLGWYVKPNDNGYKVVWHEGGMMGVSSMIKLLPDNNIAIAVIINTSNRQLCNVLTNELNKVVLPEYQPTPMNEETEIADYKPYTNDSTYFGEWNGTIKVENIDIPCSMKFQPDGTIIIEYLDFTYKSYFTQNNPIPHKTILLAGIVNRQSFIGMFPGDLPSNDIRHDLSQFMSLKLYKVGIILSGTIVAMAAADREYYAYPYYVRLEKK